MHSIDKNISYRALFTNQQGLAVSRACKSLKYSSKMEDVIKKLNESDECHRLGVAPGHSYSNQQLFDKFRNLRKKEMKARK